MPQVIPPVSLQNRLAAFFGVSVRIITILFLARFVIDIGTRAPYPFIPQLADSLGLTVVAFSQLIFIRAIAGMAGPIFGILADRYGRRKLMAAGLLCQAVGVTALTFSQQWWATIPMIIFGLSLAAFIPAEQSYISDRVAFEKRGRALAVIEFGWAVAGIIGLPLIGWMIDRFGWRVPFFILALFSLIGALMIWTQLPAVEQRSQTRLSLPAILALIRRPAVLACVAVSSTMFTGVGISITIWSIWLSADFGLNATDLGLVGTGIGVAELAGAGLSSLFIDRFGKRRGSLLGLLLTAIIFLFLPFTQASLLIAVPGLILIGLFLEFTIVSLLPLYAEQAPEARATIFSLAALGAALGGASGSPLAAGLWEQSGLWAVCLVAAGFFIAAATLTAKFLHE